MVNKDLDDLVCDFNYIANSMQLVDEKLIDVPLFYTKQLIKEFCIFPLGSPFIKTNCKQNFSSVLLFGPSGTGKTHAALSIAYHTDSIFIDLSPKNLEGKFNTKDELYKIVASAFRVAKFYQPAVIYFDNAEQIFCNPKAKGAVKNPSATRLKKLLLTYKNLVTPEQRILFIGCTNKGWHMNAKDLAVMFDKNYYFSLPSFSDRFKLWKREINTRLGRVYDIEYDVLAQMSTGYSSESVI